MIRVGPAGWSYADWEGRVYPRRKGRGFHALRYLARFVDCVEVNSSFYALPEARNAERWVELVEEHPSFRFTVKLFQGLTHGPWADTPAARDEARSLGAAFLEGVEPLRDAGRLAALLVQFPLGFQRGPTERDRLALLATVLGPIPRVLELRHGSWFAPEALEEIRDLGYSLAEIDLPRPPAGVEVWHPPQEAPRLGPLGYLRLHGRNSGRWFDPRADRDAKYDYLYSEDEVKEMVGRARRLAQGRDETYVVTNNHFGGQAVVNALEIRSALEGDAVRAPAELLRAYPRLARKANPEGQQELFG